MISIIPITFSLWVAIKSACEIYQTHTDYKRDKFIENSILHTHHHLAVLYGFLAYGIIIPIMIIVAGFEFSVEWIPVQLFLNIILLYIVEHFADERIGILKPTRFRDLFAVRKRSKKEKYEQN